MKVLKSPCAVGLLLVTEVGANVLQLKTNCGDGIAPRRHMASRDVALSPRTLPGASESPRAFAKADHRGDGLLGG